MVDPWVAVTSTTGQADGVGAVGHAGAEVTISRPDTTAARRRQGALDDQARPAVRGGQHRRRAAVAGRWRAWVEVPRLALLVVVGHLTAVAALTVPGGLHIDDFRAQAYAAWRPRWPFVFQSNRTHLSPGARTVDWLQATFAPLAHGPAVAVTLLVQLMLAVVLWRLLRRLLGPGRAALLGLVIGLFAPAVVPTIAWYRQTLTTTVSLVAVLVAVEAMVQLARRGGRRPAIVVVAATAVALMFSERAVVTVLTCTAAAVLFGGSGGAADRLRRLWHSAVPRVLGAQSLVIAAFLVAYRSGDFDEVTTAQVSLTGAATAALRTVGLDLLPAMAGGPLRWHAVQDTYSHAATPVWFAVAVAVAVGAALAVLLLSSRAARRDTVIALLFAASYAAPVWLILYVGRISRAPLVASDDLRLYSDLAVVFAVAAALLGRAAAAELRRRRQARASHAPGSRALRVVSAITALAALSFSAVSWAGFAERWHRTRTPDYVAALAADLARFRGPILSASVPPHIVPAWVQADFTTTDLVRVLDPDRELSVLDAPAKVVGPDGRLLDGELQPVSPLARADEGYCGNAPRPGSTAVHARLERPAPYFRGSVLVLGVLVADTMTLSVRVVGHDGDSHPVVQHRPPLLRRGPHRVYVPVPIGVRVAEVVVTPSVKAALCVPEGMVALAVPAR